MSESHMMQLHQMKQKIDINRVGLLATGLIDLFINKDLQTLVNTMIAYGLAQYRLTKDYIEATLCVREISPYLDLLDGKGERIEHNQWFQKITNFSEYDDLITRSRLPNDMYSIPVYQTNKDTSNDHKVYIIYGLEFLNDYRNRDVEFVEFWRKGTKLICRYNIDRNQKSPLYKYKDIQNIYNVDDDDGDKEDNDISLVQNRTNLIYHNNMIMFQTPIMFKLNDMMEVRFRYRKDIKRSYDEIKLKGIIIEPLGMSVMG